MPFNERSKHIIHGVARSPSRAMYYGLRIPIHSGRVFRREAGHRSDLIPATIPI